MKCFRRRRPHRFLSLLIAVSALGLLLWRTDSAYGQNVATDKLVGMAIAGMQSNYSQIETLQATYEQVDKDNSVEQEEVVVEKTDDGGEIIFRRSPLMKRKLRISVRGDDLRVETASEDLTVIDVFHAGVWSQYNPARDDAVAQLWKRLPDQMPHIAPLDLRQFPCDKTTDRLIEILQQGPILDAHLSSQKSENDVLVITVASKQGERFAKTFEFDLKAGFLPIRAYTKWPSDNSLLQLVEVEYAEVLGGRARWPRKLIRRFFDEGAATNFESEKWRQSTEITLVGELRINERLADTEFEIIPPIGTRVSDSVSGRIYRYKAPGTLSGTPDSLSRPRIIGLIVTSIIVIALVVVVVVGRYNARQA